MYTRFYNQLGKPPAVNLFFPSLACVLKLVISLLLDYYFTSFSPSLPPLRQHSRWQRLSWLHFTVCRALRVGHQDPRFRAPCHREGAPPSCGAGNSTGTLGMWGVTQGQGCAPWGQGVPHPHTWDDRGQVALCASTVWGGNYRQALGKPQLSISSV